jgi:hypothetical protein
VRHRTMNGRRRRPPAGNRRVIVGTG